MLVHVLRTGFLEGALGGCVGVLPSLPLPSAGRHADPRLEQDGISSGLLRPAESPRRSAGALSARELSLPLPRHQLLVTMLLEYLLLLLTLQ